MYMYVHAHDSLEGCIKLEVSVWLPNNYTGHTTHANTTKVALLEHAQVACTNERSCNVDITTRVKIAVAEDKTYRGSKFNTLRETRCPAQAGTTY